MFPDQGARARARLLLLAALLAALAGVLPATLAAALPPPATSASLPAEPGRAPALTIATVEPQILTGTGDLTLSGRVRNDTARPLAQPVVRAHAPDRPVTTRSGVAAWNDPGARTDHGPERARTTLAQPLAPGSSATFTLVVPADRLPRARSAGSLALALTLTDGTTQRAAAHGSARTLVPRLPEGTDPTAGLDLGVVVPLTLPPDPALLGPTGAERTDAWARAVGRGSTVDTLLTGLDGLGVTWLVDPTLLDPPTAADDQLPPAPARAADDEPEPTPSSTGPGPTGGTTPGSAPTQDGTPAPGSGTSSQTSTGTTQGATSGPPPQAEPTEQADTAEQTDTADPESLTAALRTRLAARSATQPTVLLPAGDPDQVALLATGGQDVVHAHLPAAPPAAVRRLAVADAQWPAVAPTRGQQSTLGRVWRTRSARAPTALLSTRQLGAGALPGPGGSTRRLGDGTPVLGYDSALSATVGADRPQDTAAARTQHVLADSLAAALAPGSARDLVLVLPRTDRVPAERLRQSLQALARAPWVRTAGVPALLQRAAAAPADARIVTTRTADAGPGASPVSAPGLRRTDADRALLARVSSAVADGAQVTADWRGTFDQLVSTRWRGAPVAHTAAADRLHRTVQAVPGNVTVLPSSVNVFTDEVQLGVTVENRLDRPVRDLRLLLSPRRQVIGITRQPAPLSLSADSRSTVRVPVRAVATGRVRVDALLTTPGGQDLGPGAAGPVQLQLNVRPTGTWLYWVLGIVAGPILVVGLYRSLSRGPRTEAELAPPTPAAQPRRDDDRAP